MGESRRGFLEAGRRLSKSVRPTLLGCREEEDTQRQRQEQEEQQGGGQGARGSGDAWEEEQRRSDFQKKEEAMLRQQKEARLLEAQELYRRQDALDAEAATEVPCVS